MPVNRRQFLQTATLAGAGTLVETQVRAAGSLLKDNLRIGILGSGLRGQSHIDLLLRRDDCTVTAVADIDPEMVRRTRALFDKHGAEQPIYFERGERDYLRLLKTGVADAVLIATPWRWHTEMATAAMEAGLYTGVEVSGAFSVDECWELVRTHERTGSHLFFLENVCYRRDVMAVLNMVRQDLFGEMIHLEGGYQHDLRAVKFNDGKQPYGGGVEYGEGAFSEARWRTEHSVRRNGDLYPTHGVGPVAMWADINRGNRFLSLTSMASKARGLREYVINHPQGGANHPSAQTDWKLGDKVTTMLTTQNGETVVLHHDTNLPRPYSLGFRVQGTKGLWMDVNQSIHLEGTSPEHRWEPAAELLKKHDHPYWRERADRAVGAGHGGMDYFLVDDFVIAAKNNTPAPIDAYDAATWMAITPLSEQSIALGGQPQPFPDFTRGRWMDRKNDFARG